jgi:hypothetical protein
MEERLIAIEERNKKVEADKKWETSLIRRGGIIVLTYIFAVLFMYTIGESQPFLKALVPTCGFLLSTLSLKFLRKLIGY